MGAEIHSDRETPLCARCALAASVRGLVARTFVRLPDDASEADVAKARAFVATATPCGCAAADARRTRLQAARLDERTAALALVLAQGEKAPADAQALVADLAAGAAKAWGG